VFDQKHLKTHKCETFVFISYLFFNQNLVWILLCIVVFLNLRSARTRREASKAFSWTQILHQNYK